MANLTDIVNTRGKYRVVNHGNVYCSYDVFIKKHAPELFSEWRPKQAIENNTIVNLILERPHSRFDDRTVCIVRRVSDRGLFIIGKEGLSKILPESEVP